jgi:hypothetical protein
MTRISFLGEMLGDDLACQMRLRGGCNRSSPSTTRRRPLRTSGSSLYCCLLLSPQQSLIPTRVISIALSTPTSISVVNSPAASRRDSDEARPLNLSHPSTVKMKPVVSLLNAWSWYDSLLPPANADGS